MNIAIFGAGVLGCTQAIRLSGEHSVTLFDFGHRIALLKTAIDVTNVSAAEREAARAEYGITQDLALKIGVGVFAFGLKFAELGEVHERRYDAAFVCVSTPSLAKSVFFGIPEPLDMSAVKSTIKLARTLTDIIIVRSTTMPQMWDMDEDADTFVAPEFLEESDPLKRQKIAQPIGWGGGEVFNHEPDADSDNYKLMRSRLNIVTELVDHGAAAPRIAYMTKAEAAFAKLANNAMLAAKLAAVNELARLAAALGLNEAAALLALRSDDRHGGSKYTAVSGLYGGTCLPKDVGAVAHMVEDFLSADARVFREVRDSNVNTMHRCIREAKKWADGNPVEVIVSGTAFKPGGSKRGSPMVDFGKVFDSFFERKSTTSVRHFVIVAGHGCDLPGVLDAIEKEMGQLFAAVVMDFTADPKAVRTFAQERNIEYRRFGIDTVIVSKDS